jgi:hypothetical protein
MRDVGIVGKSPRALVLAALGIAMCVLSTPVSGASSRQSRDSREGVSSLSYAPKPVYDDLRRMRVRFTTTGRAGPGREYLVSLFIEGPDAAAGMRASTCDNYIDSYFPGNSTVKGHILGAPGHTYTVWLIASQGWGGYFCHGRAELAIYTNSIRHPSLKRIRTWRTAKFRILRAP